MEELKTLALSMGIEIGLKKKEEICAEIKAMIGEKPPILQQSKVTKFKIKKILTTLEPSPEQGSPALVKKIVIKKIISSSAPPTKTPSVPVSGDKAVAVCIAVANLRKQGYPDLETWMKDPNNLYVGRHGRIFITDPVTKEKRIFHYPASNWANPYKVGKKGAPLKKGEYTLEDSIALYKQHLHDSGLLNGIHELRGKRLGCFCDQNEMCHAQILADLANLE